MVSTTVSAFCDIDDHNDMITMLGTTNANIILRIKVCEFILLEYVLCYAHNL